MIIHMYVDYSKFDLCQPVFCAKIFVDYIIDYTINYQSEINNSRPRLVAIPKQGRN